MTQKPSPLLEPIPHPKAWDNWVIALVVAIRPTQWIKNLACFAGLIFSGRLFRPDMQLRASIAFALFSAAASAVYLLNDYLDRHRDRANPRTARRPIASGRLPIWIAAAACVALAAAAIVGAVLLGSACAVVLTGYLILNVAYSIKLKKTVIADVMCIALGFVLRVLFGVYAVEVVPSPWIVLCMFFLALFLGFGKRRGELVSLGADAGAARPVLNKYAVPFLDLVLGISATLTIATYTLYCVIVTYHDQTMVVTVVPVVYCILRYAHQLLVENRGQSPERLLYTDRMLWIGVFSWVVLASFVIYAKPHLVSVFPSESGQSTDKAAPVTR